MDNELEHKIRDNFAEALNRFDFKKVHNVMSYLGWNWGLESHSPSEEKMINMIEKELFETAINSFNDEEISVYSGGFLVRIFKTGKVEIQFIVAQSYSYQSEK